MDKNANIPESVIALRDLITDRLVKAGFQQVDEICGWKFVYRYPCQAKPSSSPTVFMTINKGYEGGVYPVGYFVYADFRGIMIGWDTGWNLNTPKPKIKCNSNLYEGTAPSSIRLDMLDAWIKHQKELVELVDKFDKDFKKLHTKKISIHGMTKN